MAPAPSSAYPPLRPASVRADRFALRVVQAGAIGVVIAAAAYKAFDLDRFFVPKELVLHATAAVAAFACLTRRRRLPLRTLDILLAAFLALSAVSGLFATNHWAAARALAISISGALLFWTASALRRSGHERSLVAGLLAAATLAAASAVAQAYGLRLDIFSLNRVPGGTFGNRNFIAHVAAIATPGLLVAGLVARRAVGFFTATLALAVTTAALVLSRSRGAWLAIIVALALLAAAGWLTRARWRDARLRRRAVAMVMTLVAATAGATLLPNRLAWNSDSPYLDSVRGVVNYQEGSGAGRVVQYTNTAKLALRNPVLGVGPGNWPVHYAEVASRRDPSLTDSDMTANPWPSSDWAAYLAERGIPATLALLGVFGLLALGAVRQLRDARTTEQVATALALGGIVTATLVVGAFDAVLLLAAPTMIAWPLLGALAEPPRGPGRSVTRGVHQWAPVLIAAFGIAAAGRSTLQLLAMGTAVQNAPRTARMEMATKLDPGSYRLQLWAAEVQIRRGSCRSAVRHARVASELFPHAPRPQQILAVCGARRPR